MCSFPHFSPSCFEILCWNFAYDFTTDHVQVLSLCIRLQIHFLYLPLLNAKLTRIFRELYIEIESSLIEIKSFQIELKSSLIQLESSSLIQLESSLIQLLSSLYM